MKLLPLITAITASGLLPLNAIAADTSSAQQSQAQGAQNQGQNSRLESCLVDTAKLDNQKVTNLQGQPIGHIKQLLADPQTGRIRYAVLEADPSLQISDPEIAVPFSALQIEKQGTSQNASNQPNEESVAKNFTVQLDATKDKLEKAPRYKIGDAERLFTAQSAEPVYAYWAIIWTDDQNQTPNTSKSAANPSSANGRSAAGSSANPASSPSHSGSNTNANGQSSSGNSANGGIGSGGAGSSSNSSSGGNSTAR